MDPQTRQFITDELTTLLRHVPTEQEIQNGQTDTYIMGKVNTKLSSAQATTISTQVNKLAGKKVL